MRTSNKKVAYKKKFKLGPKFVILPIKVSLAINFVVFVIAAGIQPFIQPVVPLFFSLPSGSNHLVPKSSLFILPTISATINFFHIGAIKLFTLQRLIVQLVIWADVILQVILLLIAVRNIWVIV